MVTTPTLHKAPFMSALEGLRSSRPRAAFSREGARGKGRHGETEQDRISLQTLDALGLLSSEGCTTDWGLLERAARRRSGWC